MKEKLNNNKVNLLLIFIIVMCLGWLGADLNTTPMVGDWLSFIILEFCAQILYNNFKT